MTFVLLLQRLFIFLGAAHHRAHATTEEMEGGGESQLHPTLLVPHQKPACAVDCLDTTPPLAPLEQGLNYSLWLPLWSVEEIVCQGAQAFVFITSWESALCFGLSTLFRVGIGAGQLL